jgi:Domain of unknown function (DUF4062)
MTDQITIYRAFISSPQDVAAERQVAQEVMARINDISADTLGATLLPKTWTNDPPVTPRIPEQRIQDEINREVERAHFFILILYRRYGSVEPGHTKSNTERELEAILARYETNPQIKILAYFRDIPPNPDPGTQEVQVNKFKARLEEKGIRHRAYKDALDFKEQFTHDIYNVVMRLQLSPFKQRALRRFWKIGRANREVYPRAAIIFPAVSRRNSAPKGKNHWLGRLEPNVYYEDLRAIHKIQKTLSIVGVHGYKTFTTANIPHDLQYMNVIWVCFPRSHDALERLAKYGQRIRFRFERRHDVATSATWTDANGHPFEIASPLASYLELQRKKMDTTGECTARLRSIVCKDFAVVARLRNNDSEFVCDEGVLYEYFFAGIRGLGTWGAAWFLDRRARTLHKLPDEGDLQLLLEIRYENGNIADAYDVSDQPPEYFLQQNDPAFIGDEIDRFANR